MKKLFNSILIFLTQVLLASAWFILLSLPVFNMTGLIIKPLLICVIGGAAVSFVLSFLPKGEAVCGCGLLVFVVFWAVFSFIGELKLQIAHGFPGKWIEFFYFDKLLMVGTIWLAAVSVFALMRLLGKKAEEEYTLFFKTSSAAFIVFYSFLLIYSFVLIRLEKGEYPLNWVPFNTINEYISDYSSIPYEVFMMFFGNLLYFTPLGLIFYLILKKRKAVIRVIVISFFPIAAFSLLEFSQYFFQNGFCEFDDMMMNSLGFWLGALSGVIADALVKKATNGRYTSIWK